MAFIRMDQIKPALPIDVLIDRLDHLRQEFYNQSKNEISNLKSDGESERHAPEQKTEEKPSGDLAEPAHSMPGNPSIADNSTKNLDVIWMQITPQKIWMLSGINSMS
jgi:hypothetical protein